MYHRLSADSVRSTRQGLGLKQADAVVNTAGTTVGRALGSLLVFLAYLRTIQAASQGLLAVYGNVKGVEASIDRVSEVLDVEVGVSEAPDSPPLAASRAGGCAITFDHVSFGYEESAEVLHDITLEVKPGQMLAVVGPTGAGKSTLVSLVPRFFDPWS